MTCKVNADTTNGLKLESDTSGEIDLQTNGTTKVHMDSSGNVGINTSSPDTALTIQEGSADQIKLEDTSGNYWTLRCGTNFIFKDNDTERMRISSAGNLGIGTGAPGNPLSVIGNAITPVAVNRQTNDGTLISFRQDSVQEGSISVSGTLVSVSYTHLTLPTNREV